MWNEGYDSPGASIQSLKSVGQVPTMAQRLDAAVKQAEDRLVQAKRAREIFSKNPDLEELINILNRGGF